MEDENQNQEEFEKRMKQFLDSFFNENNMGLFGKNHLGLNNPNSLKDFLGIEPNLEEGIKYEKTTYITPDGTRIVINAGYGPNEKYQPPKMTKEQKIAKLKGDLKIAVDDEEFEKAAEIRDLISELEKGGEKKTVDSSNTDEDIWTL